jgi:2-(1,2-epoxy-1,2-dihydrophenyl)acetyl-CoA isomerase
MGVTVRDEGPVRVVTLDRPRAFNALDPEHFEALDAAVSAAVSAPAVRAVVLAGEGRTFCTGADVSTFARAMADGTMRDLLDALLPVFQRTILALAEGEVPTIAAVNGPAAGAGLDLALACDLRVLSDRATLSTAYGRVGLVPDGGAPHHLTRLLGGARAAELLLLPDRVVTPEEAVRWGLALEAVPRERVVARAVEVATRVAAGPSLATRLVKRLLRRDASRGLAEALADEAAAQREAVAHPDASEGVRAAAERRPPSFPGAPSLPPATPDSSPNSAPRPVSNAGEAPLPTGGPS